MKTALLASATMATSFIAQAGTISTRLGTIQPYTGIYYDPNQSGSGLSVDIGPSGKMFLEFATYDANGNQVNYFSVPDYAPSSEAQ